MRPANQVSLKGSVCEACKPLLTPVGTIIASIPNVRWLPVSLGLLWKGTWRYEDTGILDRTHLRFFTRSGIETLFAEAGYEITHLFSWNRVIPSRGQEYSPYLGIFLMTYCVCISRW